MNEILNLIIIINVISFLVYTFDKFAAKRNMYRVSEKNLLLLAFFFGAIGAFLSMKIFRHKTQKPVFMLGIPILFAFQILGLSVLYGIKIK